MSRPEPLASRSEPVRTAVGLGPAVTPPAVWTAALASRRIPPVDLAPMRRVLVLAAHPDDETIGVGGTMRLLHRAGAELTLVVATDGEAAYPGLDVRGRAELARIRRRELAAAMRTAGLAEVPVRWLGLPDGRLADHEAELTELLTPLVAPVDVYLAPWRGDPHPDHQAAGRAAASAVAAGTAAGAPPAVYGWGYPIWMWPWLRPDQPDIPWARAHAVRLPAADLAAKLRSRARYRSQISEPPTAAAPVLSAEMLAHGERDVELLFREPAVASAPLGHFERLYAEGDPWSDDSWYERRKRAVLAACLPRERYERAFEPGCGEGALTALLAGRCGWLCATEPVATAAARARRRTPGVVVRTAALPEGVPPGPLDLVVFSEVLYYLDDTALAATLDAVLPALAPDADVVVAHWSGWPADAPRSGAAVVEALAARPELRPLLEHHDEEFTVHVLRRAGSDR